MMVRAGEDRKATFSGFFLAGTVLSVCSEITYLGNIISDDKDIHRRRRKL